MSLYISGGSKGGVGKSILTMAFLDHLQAQEKVPLLIESDDSNPDVWKAYRDSIDCAVLNLEEEAGWLSLLDHFASYDGPIVVNTGARNIGAIERYAPLLLQGQKELQKPIYTLWIINRGRDSVELLKNHMDALGEHPTWVFRNLFFGPSESFNRYNDSKLRKQINPLGGTLDFPELAARVIDALHDQRLTINEAEKQLPFGNKIALQGWRSSIHNLLEVIT